MELKTQKTLAGNWIVFTPFTLDDFTVEQRPASEQVTTYKHVTAEIVLTPDPEVSDRYMRARTEIGTIGMAELPRSIKLVVRKTVDYKMQKNTSAKVVEERVKEAVEEANVIFADSPARVEGELESLNGSVQKWVDKQNENVKARTVEMLTHQSSDLNWAEIADAKDKEATAMLKHSVAAMQEQIDELKKEKAAIEKELQAKRNRAFLEVLNEMDWRSNEWGTPPELQKVMEQVLENGEGFAPHVARNIFDW